MLYWDRQKAEPGPHDEGEASEWKIPSAGRGVPGRLGTHGDLSLGYSETDRSTLYFIHVLPAAIEQLAHSLEIYAHCPGGLRSRR